MSLHKKAAVVSSSSDAPRRAPRPWWRGKRLIAAVIVLAALVIGIKLVSAPVQGHTTAVDIPFRKPATTHATTDTAPSQVTNTYYQLDLPAGYHAQPANSGVPGLLLSQLITKPGALGSLIINLAVKTMPVGGLSEDSSYRACTQQTSRYSLSSQTRAGNTIEVCNDHQSAAISAFWPHGGYLGTFGVSSSVGDPTADDNADEQATLTTILDAWQWQ